MKNNFLISFWRGNVKLPISYWIFGVILFPFIFVLDFSVFFLFNIMNLHGILFFPYVIFWCVGTWRAAKKHTGKPRWASLTKLSVILIGGFFMTLFIYAQYL